MTTDVVVMMTSYLLCDQILQIRDLLIGVALRIDVNHFDIISTVLHGILEFLVHLYRPAVAKVVDVVPDFNCCVFSGCHRGGETQRKTHRQHGEHRPSLT